MFLLVHMAVYIVYYAYHKTSLMEDIVSIHSKHVVGNPKELVLGTSTNSIQLLGAVRWVLMDVSGY
jgi:hypothetical protein